MYRSRTTLLYHEQGPRRDMDINNSNNLLQRSPKHHSDDFIVGSPPRSPPRWFEDVCSRIGDGLTNMKARDDGQSESLPQVRNHRRSSTVRIEVDEQVRRRSLPNNSSQRESSLFQGRLEAFLETCVELAVHEQIARVVTEHVASMLRGSMAQKEICCQDVAELEEDLGTLKSCQRDLEKEKASIFERTSKGNECEYVDTTQREGHDLSSSLTQLRRDSTRHSSWGNGGAAQVCPVQCAALTVISALSSVFYRSPASALSGPPASPMDCSSDFKPFSRPVASPSNSLRYTDGYPKSRKVVKAPSADLLARKAQLTQRPLGEHLFLPGVQIDKNATIEQALADARYMNQLLPSHAMDIQDSAQIVERLLRLVTAVEVDITALRQESKLELSDLERNVLRLSSYQYGKLSKSLQSFEIKLQERQNAAFIGLIETASMQVNCSPTAALQSTICPAIVRRAGTVKSAKPEKDHLKHQRPGLHRRGSDTAMAIYSLENMSL